MEFKRGYVKKIGGELLLQGYTVPDIAEKYHLSRDTVLTYNKTIWKVPLQKKMSETEKEIAKEMIVEGFTYKDIGKRLGYRESTIQDKNNKYWKLPYAEIQKSKKLVERTCMTCGKKFHVRKQKLKHDACNYCSKKCSHIGAIKPYKTLNPIYRGYRWAYLSKEIRRETPFCQRCGTQIKPLCVHHIKPWRLGGTNEPENLLVLCNSCHRILETGTQDLFELLSEDEALKIIQVIYSYRKENLRWNLSKLKQLK